MNDFSQPLGLHQAVQAIHNLCASSVPYENTRAAPSLIELDAGNGQTTFTKYAARMAIKHKIRQVVGLTTYLEFTVDPKKDQMQMMFGQIAAAAKGVNNYESVISFDITALTECVHEEQTEFFLNRLKEIAKHAIVLLYISPTKVKSAAKHSELKEKLKESIAGLQIVEVDPYTTTELCQMVLKKLDDYGIDIVDTDAFTEKLELVVAESNLSCAKETEAIAEMLVKQASVNRFYAVLDVQGLARAFPNICNKGVVA